jgi:hypothetical protein
VDATDVRTRMLAQFGIRIEPAMSDYVLRQLERSANAPFPVMGGDARTGVPVRRFIPASAFAGASPQQQQQQHLSNS